ncbi:MAG: hypothetical protein ACK4VI_03800 [Alphaproteobacteria bacterium]
MPKDKIPLEERIRARWNVASHRPDAITEPASVTPQLQKLLDRHIALCIEDVAAILRESTAEFYVQYQVLKSKNVDDFDAHSRIFERNNFPYADALYDLRSTEALTGRRHSLNINKYFLPARFSAFMSDSFQRSIREYMEQREWQKAQAISDFSHFRLIHQPKEESAEDYTALSTHQIIAVLRNYQKPNSSGFLRSNARQMAVLLAQAPEEKVRLVEDGLQQRAESFVRSLAYIQDPQLFIAKINQKAKTLPHTTEQYQASPNDAQVISLFGKEPD